MVRFSLPGALQVFRTEWPDLVRLQLTEVVVAQAGALAWDLGLRGDDAVHLWPWPVSGSRRWASR
jgi:hypothetical protein